MSTFEEYVAFNLCILNSEQVCLSILYLLNINVPQTASWVAECCKSWSNCDYEKQFNEGLLC